MLFKYQAPLHFHGTSIECAGQTYFIDIRNIIESDKDIYFALHPLGFKRVVAETKAETKKEVAVVKP